MTKVTPTTLEQVRQIFTDLGCASSTLKFSDTSFQKMVGVDPTQLNEIIEKVRTEQGIRGAETLSMRQSSSLVDTVAQQAKELPRITVKHQKSTGEIIVPDAFARAVKGGGATGARPVKKRSQRQVGKIGDSAAPSDLMAALKLGPRRRRPPQPENGDLQEVPSPVADMTTGPTKDAQAPLSPATTSPSAKGSRQSSSGRESAPRGDANDTPQTKVPQKVKKHSRRFSLKGLIRKISKIFRIKDKVEQNPAPPLRSETERSTNPPAPAAAASPATLTEGAADSLIQVSQTQVPATQGSQVGVSEAPHRPPLPKALLSGIAGLAATMQSRHESRDTDLEDGARPSQTDTRTTTRQLKPSMVEILATRGKEMSQRRAAGHSATTSGKPAMRCTQSALKAELKKRLCDAGVRDDKAMRLCITITTGSPKLFGEDGHLTSENIESFIDAFGKKIEEQDKVEAINEANIGQMNELATLLVTESLEGADIDLRTVDGPRHGR